MLPAPEQTGWEPTPEELAAEEGGAGVEVLGADDREQRRTAAFGVVTGSVVPDGPSVVVNITNPGDTAVFTTTKAPGARLAIRSINSTFSEDCNFEVWDSDSGSGYPERHCNVTTFPEFIELLDPGTIEIRIEPTNNETGSLTLQVWTMPPDLVGTTTPAQGATRLDVAAPGHRPTVEFHGEQGQWLWLSLTGSSLPTGSGCAILVERLDGSNVGWFGCGNGNWGFSSVLPGSETYTISVFLSLSHEGFYGGGIDVDVNNMDEPQMIHHNISGNVINGGEVSALIPLLSATASFGLPQAYSLNEACQNHTETLDAWVTGFYGGSYSNVTFVQNFNIAGCDQGTGDARFGAGLLTIGSGHESSATCTGSGAGQQCGHTYKTQGSLEPRGAVCMAYGMLGTVGNACTTHLDGGNTCNLDPEPPGCEDDYPKFGQFEEYYNIVQWARTVTGKPVTFAGDLYLTQDEMEGVGTFTWSGNRNADPSERWTNEDSNCNLDQVDHIVGASTQTSTRPAHVAPVDGVISRLPDDEECGDVEVIDTFPSDHRLVVSFIQM